MRGGNNTRIQRKERKKTVGFMIIFSFLYLPPKQMLKQMAENELKVYEEEVRDCRRAAGKVNQRKPKNQGRKSTASRSSEEMMSSPATLFTLSLQYTCRFLKENEKGYSLYYVISLY